MHISIEQETTPWHKVSERISSEGISSIVSVVDRKRIEEKRTIRTSESVRSRKSRLTASVGG